MKHGSGSPKEVVKESVEGGGSSVKEVPLVEESVDTGGGSPKEVVKEHVEGGGTSAKEVCSHPHEIAVSNTFVFNEQCDVFCACCKPPHDDDDGFMCYFVF